MKKTLLYSMLVTGTFLFGCSQAPQTMNPSNSQVLNSNTQSKITEEQAKQIALNEAGGGQVAEFSYDMDDITPHYDIKVLNGTTEYELEISAVDGSILKRSNEFNKVPTSEVKIDEAKAKEIALSQVSGGTIGEFKLDYENGFPVYEITIYEGKTEYDFEISGVDGTIISRSVDNRFD